jgi:hypothetical protein
MRALLSAIAVIALASPALAVDWCTANMPPDEYRHEPDQTYLIAEWPHDLLGAVCSNGGLQWIREGNHGGCFVRDKEDRSFAYIYVLAGLAPDQRECVIIHEKAHLNGWTHGPSYIHYLDENGNYRPQRGPFRRRVAPDL